MGDFELLLQVVSFHKRKKSSIAYSWFSFPISRERSYQDSRVGYLNYETKNFSYSRLSRGNGSKVLYQNESTTLKSKRMEVERGDPRIVMDPPVTLLIVSEHGRGGVRCSLLGLLFSYLVNRMLIRDLPM